MKFSLTNTNLNNKIKLNLMLSSNTIDKLNFYKKLKNLSFPK